MNFIIFDVEATCWENRPPHWAQEIIEIGAVKVNRYGEYVSQFDRFVRPVVHPTLSPYCTHLTSIEQPDINRAAYFPEVIEAFQDWIDIWDEDYQLCSWGKFDLQMLLQDSDLHNLETDWLDDAFINLKHQYHDLKGLRKMRGLKKSVEKEGFEFTGLHHRAISDAENLSKIFAKYVDMWQY